MKILNLYAGIGGNRKLWGDEHEITAVEIDPEIAAIYQDFFPNDEVIVGDAHQYLLEHFKEYDFIWSSPPCPSHSRMRRINSGTGPSKSPHTYPDMQLYQEILFLKHFFKGNWVVENVIAYYKPLVKPQKMGRHYIWSNFDIEPIEVESDFSIKGSKRECFDISKKKCKHRKDQIMRNCFEPKLAEHILKALFVFESAFKKKQEVLYG